MLSFSSQDIGFYGEMFARFIIEQKTSLKSTRPVETHSGDLRLSNGLLIEVKTITQNKDSTYRATIRKGKSQSLIHADYVLLQVLTADWIFFYIIPSNKITAKRISISNPITYTGKFHEFHNRFDLLQIV